MGQPIVYIRPEVKIKLDLYIELCKYEISGLGIVKKLGDDLLIDEFFLIEQEVSSGSTDLDPKAVAKLMTECLAAEKDPGDIKFWFHSHATMDSFWSGTDVSTINSFKNDYFVSIVGNKKGKYKTRIDIFEPLRITLENISLEVYYGDIGARLVKEVKSDIEKKVKYVPAVVVGYTGGRPNRKRRQGKRGDTRDSEPIIYTTDDTEELVLPCHVCDMDSNKCKDCNALEDFDWNVWNGV